MEKEKPTGIPYLIGGLLLVALGLAVGVPKLIAWRQARERKAVYDEIVRPLYRPAPNEEGYWVGDVAELFRLGLISRELAEADTAPLNPLVSKPVPFHGYYVRAMESGLPTSSTNEPTRLKGKKRCLDTFAICIYPAEPGPGKYSWIMCGRWELRRSDGQSDPLLQWPSPQEFKAHWAIVD